MMGNKICSVSVKSCKSAKLIQSIVDANGPAICMVSVTVKKSYLKLSRLRVNSCAWALPEVEDARQKSRGKSKMIING